MKRGFDSEPPLADVNIAEAENTDIRSLQREMEFIRKSSDALKNRCHDFEKQLIELNLSAEQPAATAEKINEITARIAEMRRNHSAYMLAYDKLREASDDLRRNISPKLSEISGRIIGMLTDGKYKTLDVGRNFEFAYSADGQTRQSVHMSAGTLDAAYISLRFALLDVLYGGIKPPVIFDESFSRLDEHRLKNMLRFVAGAANTGLQLIIFTNQRRDAEIMDGTGKYKHTKMQGMRGTGTRGREDAGTRSL
jgi:uncharacterized protein YhaN